MKRVEEYLVFLLLSLVIAFGIKLATGCAKTETVTAPATELGLCALALQGCIYQAWQRDGGYAGYERCAEGVDAVCRPSAGAGPSADGGKD